MAMKAALLLLALVMPVALHAQSGLDAAGISVRKYEAMVALDRYLETWNSRDAATWATSLHFPHVRPGPGAFEMTRSPEEYAKGVSFEATLKTGWHHSEWVTREVLQIGADKIHAAGTWRRYTADDKPLQSSDITYIITRIDGRWGVQARFAAGVNGIDKAGASKNAAAALEALKVFLQAWNSHDEQQLAAAIHFPHVRIADGRVETWRAAADYLAGPEPGRQRTWYQTRLDSSRVVQATATGVNIVLSFSRLDRKGAVLSKDEGLFLAVVRDGSWKIQARSTFGS
jgi:hypothetical protein